jgi:hypothetical protein
VKVEHPEIIKLNSSKFKTFSINRVLVQPMHVDLNHTLYHLELNAEEKSDGYCPHTVVHVHPFSALPTFPVRFCPLSCRTNRTDTGKKSPVIFKKKYSILKYNILAAKW